MADSYLTIPEYSRELEGTIQGAVMEIIGQNSAVLPYLKFQDIGNLIKEGIKEKDLGTSAFRLVNADIDANPGETEKIYEALSPLSREIKFDSALTAGDGATARALQESMALKGMANFFTKKFIKGDSSTTAADMDGLQIRCDDTNTNLVVAGTTDGGDALSLKKLDELCMEVEGRATDKKLLMSDAMLRLLTTAMRASTIGGQLRFDRNEFGQLSTFYGDIEVIPMGYDDDRSDILGFNEVNPGSTGSTATATSIYCVNFGDELGIKGLQNGPLTAQDQGQQGVFYTTFIQWIVGLWVPDHYAKRLAGISNAAVTA